jgi:hypothetical protein
MGTVCVAAMVAADEIGHQGFGSGIGLTKVFVDAILM